MPRLRHYDHLGTARFVTFSCYRRLHLLRSEAAMQIFARHVLTLRSRHQIKILGYCLMPNHVHLVLHPPDNIELGVIIGQIKGRSAREIIRHMRDQGEPGRAGLSPDLPSIAVMF